MAHNITLNNNQIWFKINQRNNGILSKDNSYRQLFKFCVFNTQSTKTFEACFNTYKLNQCKANVRGNYVQHFIFAKWSNYCQIYDYSVFWSMYSEWQSIVSQRINFESIDGEYDTCDTAVTMHQDIDRHVLPKRMPNW